jgi:serine/threonine protein kinase
LRKIKKMSDEPYFDLSRYVQTPFVLTRSDAEHLGRNVGLPGHKELRAFVEYPNPSNSFDTEINNFQKTAMTGAGYYGLVLEGTYHGRPCVAKVINVSQPDKLVNTLQELLIQVILCEALLTAPPSSSREHKVKIPQIHSVFRTTSYMHNYEVLKATRRVEFDTSAVHPVVVVVMERVETDLMKITKEPTMTAEERSELCTIALIEMINTFKYFETLGFNFIHGDLKTNNVMLTADASVPGRYQIYMIDFGMSSLDFKGVRIGAGQIFETIRFANPGYTNHLTDIVYLVWSMWKFVGCDMSLRARCERYTERFEKVLRIILFASGIPFRTDRRFDGISPQTFRSMLTAGVRIRQEDIDHERSIKKDLIEMLVREYMRIHHVDPAHETIAREQVHAYVLPQLVFQYVSTDVVYPISLNHLHNIVKAYIRSIYGSTEGSRRKGQEVLDAIVIPS